MRILTAGESHGLGMVTIIEGFPQGVKIKTSFINQEIKKRMHGVGRGKRMQIESDTVEIISGLRNERTLGSPIAMLVKNKDQYIFAQDKDCLKPLVVPRPGHADLAGCLKYGEKDIRNILERSSARETVSRVCAGSICKQFLSYFNIRIISFVSGIGRIVSTLKPLSIDDIARKIKKSRINCLDLVKEKLMIREIEEAKNSGDTVGGIIEVWADGILPGLGSCMHFDKRLDAKLAGYMMSLPSVKAVEIGAGFNYTKMRGSVSHDAIFAGKKNEFMRKTNNCGGIEGGVSNGSPIVVRLGSKPIPTLMKPLNSVNIITRKKKKASVVRADVCVIEPLGLIAENMLAIALTESFLEKFGSDRDRKSTRLNSSHTDISRMPSSA